MNQAKFMMMVVDRFELQRDAVRVSVKKRCCTSEMLASGGVLREIEGARAGYLC